MKFTEDQHLQRSQFQFEIIKLNMLVNGGLIAFSIDNQESWRHLLIACPIASLILFSLWFHHALVILIEQGGSGNSPQGGKTTGIQKLRIWSFALSMLANFVLLPASAIFVFSLQSINFLSYFAIAAVFITTLLFFLWFYIQYFNSQSVSKFLD